jgi:hypothetical protein
MRTFWKYNLVGIIANRFCLHYTTTGFFARLSLFNDPLKHLSERYAASSMASVPYCRINMTMEAHDMYGAIVYVRFEVFTALTVKNAVFWDVAPCNLVWSDVSEECVIWKSAHRVFYLEDGGNTFLRNVGSYKMYKAPHPRRRHGSILIRPS